MKTYETSGNILFEEKQKYPRWIAWVIVLAMFLTVIALLAALFTENDNRQTLIGLLVVVPVAIMAIFLNRNIQLEKVVTSNGLYYRWKPFHKRWRVIEKEDIQSYTVRTFPFLSYGFGWFPTYGWYHNASRGEGLQLYLKDGRKYFFSTGDKDQFEAAIQNLKSSNPKSSLREF